MIREIFGVFRSRQQLGGSGPAPTQVDALEGKDKGGKAAKTKARRKGIKTHQCGAGAGKGHWRKDDKQAFCFYCGKTGHDCRQRPTDSGLLI
eukprot:960494-Amphidinium_carterae.1